MGRARDGLRRAGRWLGRLLILTALALAAGLAWGWHATVSALPGLDGNVWGMLAGEDWLMMVLSNGANNCLVRTDYSGRVLNYANTADHEAYQYLEAAGDGICAIRAVFEQGKNRQELVSFSTEKPLMRPRVLLELSSLEGAPEGIVWKQLYPPEEGSDTLRLAGIDGSGQGYLLRWEAGSGGWTLEKVLEGEALYFLKYVREGRYVWIGRDGRAGQEVDGVRQYGVLSGGAKTPYHISTCGQRCFLSDSVTGNIWELAEGGTAALFRRGDEGIGAAGVTYRQMDIFTTQPGPDGAVHPLAFCAAPEGGVVAGDLHTIRSLDAGDLLPWLVLANGWQAAAAAWLVLAALEGALFLLLRSRRLVVRLSVCELLVELALTAALILAQLSSFQNALETQARQKLLLLGGNLAYALSSGEPLDGAGVARMADRVRNQLRDILGAEAGEYTASVYRIVPEGLAVVYDQEVPAGVLAESVRNRSYLQEVRSGMASTRQVTRVQNANNVDYLYVEAFRRGTWEGCVALSQAEEAILADRTSFLWELFPILASCPALFLLLILLTRRLLRPLDDIRDGLRAFYDTGGGNTIPLDRMSRTELYEIGRVFNSLSVETKRQFNDLRTINRAYARLVPDCLLQMLGRRTVQELSPGDAAVVDGAVLILLPEVPARTAAELRAGMAVAAERIYAREGFLVDRDERLGSLTAVFAQAEQARGCAGDCLSARKDIIAAVFTERVEVGVFGSKDLLYPLAVSRSLYRRLAAMGRLRDFGAVLVHSGAVSEGGTLRLLGWDGGLTYYEDTAFRESGWQTRWQEARPLWTEAMEAFRGARFGEAMRRFARVLRVLPGDGAARWYLFRCDALRCAADAGEADTELLFDWREDHGEAANPEAGASEARADPPGLLAGGPGVRVEASGPAGADGRGGGGPRRPGTALVPGS